MLRLLPMSDRDLDVEVLALHHQIAVLERQLNGQRVRFDAGDRAFLAALLQGLRRMRLLVRPDTVLRWHRDMVARRHAARSRPKRGGRPRNEPRPGQVLPADGVRLEEEDRSVLAPHPQPAPVRDSPRPRPPHHLDSDHQTEAAVSPLGRTRRCPPWSTARQRGGAGGSQASARPRSKPPQKPEAAATRSRPPWPRLFQPTAQSRPR